MQLPAERVYTALATHRHNMQHRHLLGGSAIVAADVDMFACIHTSPRISKAMSIMLTLLTDTKAQPAVGTAQHCMCHIAHW